MLIRRVIGTVGVLVCLGLMTSVAQADIGRTQDVYYTIHEDASDPGSPVAFVVHLSLAEADSDGDSVGWEVTEAQFRQPVGGTNVDRVWTISDPPVSSADGLWWIDHADASALQLAEFDMFPSLTGVAPANDPNDADLHYALVGTTYTPPPGGAPYDVTASLSYEFTEDGASTPMLAGTDVPVELEDDEDEPLPE